MAAGEKKGRGAPLSSASVAEAPGPTVDAQAKSVPATLIYNPNAGGAGLSPDELVELLRDAGFEAVHRPTESVSDLDAIFRETEGPVVVAGGDGTIREVARRLWRTERPLVVVPLGTANNTARSLGIIGKPVQVIAGLERPRRVRVDVARARGPWGEEFVLEGAGLGLFANVLATYQPEAGKSLLRGVAAAANSITDNAVRCRLELDGEQMNGEFLLVEVMNTPAIGPRLALAPDADPTDGLLDVILVRHENRDAWLAYLRRLVTGGLEELPSVEVARGRKVRINWRHSAFHVDAEVLCEGSRESASKGYSAQIELVPAALEVWLPAATE